VLSKVTEEKLSPMFQDADSSFIPKSAKDLQHHKVVLARTAQSQFSARDNFKSLVCQLDTSTDLILTSVDQADPGGRAV